MNAKDLILNIAVNLGRIGRWAGEGKRARIEQFIAETNEYLRQLESVPKSQKFEATLQSFKKSYQLLTSDLRSGEDWAEEMFTWANILTHRSVLA